MAALGAPGRRICASNILRERGEGIRFAIVIDDSVQPAFIIRYEGRVHAFLNRCAHKDVELDWNPGVFFDVERRHLICATHGARYDPVSGHCVAGPCNGRGLQPLAVVEIDGEVHLAGQDRVQLAPTTDEREGHHG